LYWTESFFVKSLVEFSAVGSSELEWPFGCCV
jgi:hypothetical protein